MTTPTPHYPPPEWTRLQRQALGTSAAGLVVCMLVVTLLGQSNVMAALLRAYLVAWNFWLGIAVGSLALLMLQYLTGGAWGILLRRPLEAAAGTLPLLGLLFTPVVFGAAELYPWVERGEVDLKQKQDYYLNVPFFALRASIYFATWSIAAYWLNRWSRAADQSAQFGGLGRFRLLSGPGLVLLGLTVTFASIDWIMSLEPHWASSIFGLLSGAGYVLSGFAFALMVLIMLGRQPPLSDVLGGTHARDLASLLLAFIMVWAYLAFSQFLVIWAGNLPEEIPWYLTRLSGGWEWVALSVALLGFPIPFLLLLSGGIKRDPRALAGVAGLVLLVRFVDLFWQIVPAGDSPDVSTHGGLLVHGLDALLAVGALIALGGTWVAVFLAQLRKAPLLPIHEASVLEAADHG